MTIRISSIDALTPSVISKIIEGERSNQARMKKLENYYIGKSAITNRVLSDSTKPNNKIVNPFANYITQTMCGYFMGKPPSYSNMDEQMEVLFRDNDEQEHNASLAMDASIFGVAYEMYYTNESGETRIVKMSPMEVIPIYGDTMDEALIGVIRYYSVEDITKPAGSEKSVVVELYTSSAVLTYTGNAFNTLTFAAEAVHYFQDVPFAVYENNDYKLGDYELVISLIDAYDLTLSDAANDFEAFVNSYLVLKGMTAEAEDVQAMKEARVLLLDMDSDASWLTKDANQSENQTLLTNYENNIHKFSHCPDMNDENFASNASGVAMRYKTLGTEDVCLIKERKFKKGLERRLNVLNNILSVVAEGTNIKDIQITFYRNLPVSLSEDVDALIKMAGIISNKTILEQLPFVEDVDAEMVQVMEERVNSMPTFFTEPIDEDVNAE